MAYELIRYDVLNGSKKAHKEDGGIIFSDKKEMEAYRKRLQEEYPDYEIFLSFRDLNSKSTTNG